MEGMLVCVWRREMGWSEVGGRRTRKLGGIRGKTLHISNSASSAPRIRSNVSLYIKLETPHSTEYFYFYTR